MLTRCKGIIFAVFLGLICPAIIMSMLYEKNPKPITDIPEITGGTVKTDAEPLCVSVLMQDAEIRTMGLNDYLVCVLLREMPASFELEALKAQAVVARTYTLRRHELTGKHTGAAVCTNSDCCQGYYDIEEYMSNGGSPESVQKIQQAVSMTDGLVLRYEGDLIDATYFSCSGGMTEDAKAVWGREIPYLQSTQSPGEENAAHYLDTVTFSVKDFLALLDINEVSMAQIGDIRYTEGGGVDSISVCGKQFKGTQFRQILGLRSTAFVISVVGDTVTVTTKGFGHRVGMSQYGADAMAVGGSTFAEILAHYYKGTQLVTYNGN